MAAIIRPLPEAVRSSVRSGIFLFDLTRVVEELVFNSLDARATKVSVFVNVGSCYLKVVDDGGGITRDGLELVGERYATSKFLNLADLNAISGNFGFRGEALASISEVSLLEIVTRTYGRPNGYRKVLKGCKCLYLGLDDDRKEVGTTVVVRELFYNQPVRRKYMQSSPNKVLQSIKKSAMRLALVHSSISFNVVDIEREAELFCTHSASSPLSLVTSGFGLEVTSSLHQLDVENDTIKLSGYVSSPCNTLQMKALQYVYINSQFVCKGPIHKLLSQLAIKFENLKSLNTDNEFQNKKRSRSQPCPAYILNLRCPRSLYDLTFEPSKTYVKFKDWVPILNFIEKVIRQFWEDSIAGDFSNQGTYMVQEDQLGKVDAAVKIVSAEADTSKFGKQNPKDCLDLFFSASNKLTEDDYHESSSEDVRTSLDYLQRGTSVFKEQQSKGDFLCQTDYSDNLLDDPYTKCMSTMLRKRDSLMSDNNHLLQGDYFLDGTFPAAESFYDNVPFDKPSSSRGIKFNEVEVRMVSGSFEGNLVNDFRRFGSGVEIGGDFQKPFLKSCTTRKGSTLHEKALLVNDEHELQTDSFFIKKNLEEDYRSGKDMFADPCLEVAKKLKTSKDTDFPFRAWSEENCLPPVSCNSGTQIRSSGSDDQLLNSEWFPVCLDPSSQDTALGVHHTTDIDDIGVSRDYKRIRCTKLFYDKVNECDFSYMSRNASQHHCLSSFANNGFNFDGAVDRDDIFDRLVDWTDFGDTYFTKRPDILDEEQDWLLHESSVRNCNRSSTDKGKREHFRHTSLGKNHERSKRSSSAPPFHRSKRRFICLHQAPETIAKRSPGRASSPIFNHHEASDPQQSPGALHTSTDDLLLQEFKTNVKQSSEVLGDSKVNDIAETDGFESFSIQNSDPLRELISGEVQDSVDYRTKWRDCSPQIPKDDKLVDTQSQHNILDISSGFLHLAGDSLIPETISKKCLDDAKVLHQVDKKFIPIVAGRTLAIIDQHAADERIRLEELRQKVLSGEAKSITYLDAEQELVLPEIGYQLLHNYSEQIKDWGWICNIHGQHSESFRRNLDILNRHQMAFTLIAVPCILGANLNDVDLLEYLQQLADTDGSSTMPPSVIRVLNSKACRGAIMFGDSLLPSECSLIVEELRLTSLCFQCAHGRPTTVPLVNLEALHNQIPKLGRMNDYSSDKWHGLQRCEISLERAARRLSCD
ncbi:DNA mismatch repair protein MLH3 isoform X2 [Lotus japonicus]|uniref:DNA mismatch repair protein MLH3 isoform X2 n=1 Tax=Lotus japonicus TaxID=34305 RepID=UPI00258C1EB1|nr:DNA mismatch repair protein MLH3 isoform X2 [Lotus japonicus]